MSEDLFWQILRQNRDQKLLACDWTQAPDARARAKDPAAWAVYRQALADLPGNTIYADGMSVEQAPWPTDPNGNI